MADFSEGESLDLIGEEDVADALIVESTEEVDKPDSDVERLI